MSVRPPSAPGWLFRGSVLADGLLLDEAGSGRDELRRRVFELWTPGARLRSAGGRWVLAWPAPRRLQAEEAPGLPLVRVGRCFLAAPVEAVESPGGATGDDTVVVVYGGMVRAWPLGADEDPSVWIDFGPGEVLTSEPVGQASDRPLPGPLPPPTEPVLAPSLGMPPEERSAVLQALSRPPPASALIAGPGPRRRVGAWISTVSRKSFSPNFRLVSLLLLCFLICLLVRSPAFDILLVILLAALLFLVGLRPRGATGTSVAVAPGFGTAPAPGLMVRLRVAWSRLLARTALYRVFGWRHTRYFRQFVQALEKGDWREGLRRAVPLGALDAWKNALASPAWRLPRPRETLGIDLAGGRNSPRAIVVAGSFYADLHALYRATFERLVAEGRIEEAAFVLADLLRASTEAVGFLERHGRLTTAAQLAEARELPPGLVVRQWFLAGDVGRAVRIARDRGAFFDAVRRTERTEPEVSRALRLQWADALADGGDFAGAARTAWTVPEAVPLVRGWVERGLTVGEGDVAALLAMRALQNAQDGKLDLRAEQERLEVRLFLDTPPSHANGFGFVRALYAMGMSPGVRPLARWALRRALQLEPASQSGSVAQLARLARSADDAALAADLPRRSPPVESFPERRAPLDLALAGTGPTPIYDVVLFGSGRSVLALGEAGIALLDARGRLLRRVDEPAHRLVRSDHGDRVLLLARRGASHRVCRVELATGRIRDLGDVQVHTFASSYDGRHLFVGEGDRLLALVADEDRLRVAWSTGLEEKRVAVVGRAPDRLSVVVASDDFELWTFSLPGLVLRRREAVTVPGITSGDGRSRGVVMPVAIAADGVPLILVCKGSAGEAAVFRGGPGLASRWSPADPASNDLPTVFAAGVSGDVVWLAGHQPLSGVLELRLFQEGEMRARLRLPHSRTASVSVAHERVAVADDQGRFAVLDLDTGALWGHSGAVDGEGGTV